MATFTNIDKLNSGGFFFLIYNHNFVFHLSTKHVCTFTFFCYIRKPTKKLNYYFV